MREWSDNTKPTQLKNFQNCHLTFRISSCYQQLLKMLKTLSTGVENLLKTFKQLLKTLFWDVENSNVEEL